MNIPCNHSTVVWPTTIAQPVVFILRRQDKVLVKKWLHLRQRVCLGFFESTFICIGHCVMSGLALWVGPQNTPGRATGTTAPSSELLCQQFTEYWTTSSWWYEFFKHISTKSFNQKRSALCAISSSNVCLKYDFTEDPWREILEAYANIRSLKVRPVKTLPDKLSGLTKAKAKILWPESMYTNYKSLREKASKSHSVPYDRIIQLLSAYAIK